MGNKKTESEDFFDTWVNPFLDMLRKENKKDAENLERFKKPPRQSDVAQENVDPVLGPDGWRK